MPEWASLRVASHARNLSNTKPDFVAKLRQFIFGADLLNGASENPLDVGKTVRQTKLLISLGNFAFVYCLTSFFLKSKR